MEEGQEQQPEEGLEAKTFVDKATKLILENLANTDFTIDQLCREMAMSRTLFYVKLKSYTGKSPQDFVRIIRLERAAILLRNGRSVTDVAALTGFDNPKYFSTVFKKYFDVSPSKYQ
jgi:AraC-like DNA-binding protein